MYQLIREKSEIYKKMSNFVHENCSPFLGLKTQKMQGNKWGMYLHTWVCIHTFSRNWVCKRYVFLLKGMYLKKIGLNNGKIVK